MKIKHIVHPKHKYYVDRNFKWSEWVAEHKDDCGLCDPPLHPQTAIDILYEYLLPEFSSRNGCGYITTMPESTLQTNSRIVNELLYRYSDEFRREIADKDKSDHIDNLIEKISKFLLKFKKKEKR